MRERGDGEAHSQTALECTYKQGTLRSELYDVITMPNKQPSFKTEAQEAEWWAKNQNMIADRLEPKPPANSAKELWRESPRSGLSKRGVASDYDPAGGRGPHASQNLPCREGVAVPDVPKNAAASGSELRGEKRGASMTPRNVGRPRPSRCLLVFLQYYAGFSSSCPH